MAGDGAAALDNLGKAVRLSPLDPFLYAMMSARGMAHFHMGDMDAATLWAERGAGTPGAHYLISAFAAAINEAAGNHAQALYWTEKTMHRRQDASIETFFSAFPFRDAARKKILRDALAAVGFPERTS